MSISLILNMSESFSIDSRSTAEIIKLTLTTADEDIYWDYVWTLQARGSHEELIAASKLCESHNPKDRSLGVQILGQLGMPVRTLARECGDVLLKLLAIETDSLVLASIGIAFGNLNDPRGVLPLIKWKNHPNPGVRMGVVLGITCQEDELAIDALIELSADEDPDIRNWATFGLGSQIETNTSAIRDALFDRAILELGEDDPMSEIRGEALLGLAMRHDPRVINPLIEELQSGCVGKLAVEAASIAGNARLYPALVDLQEWWDVDNKLLQVAITNCRVDRD
jgi:HEAT repeat protein